MFVKMYEVRLPVFEGPLDLLLNLIEKKELDITTVSLLAVTEQYLEHLRSGEQIDPENLGSFLVIAAKLLYIKSHSLLPRPTVLVIDEDEDAGEELARLLIEYKKFKLAAKLLKENEEKGVRSYPRMAPPPIPEFQAKLETATFDILLKALERALASKKEPEQQSLPVRVFTVEEKMEDIKLALEANGRASFTEMLSAATTRQEMVVLFLALLQLLKRAMVNAIQGELFSDIIIYKLVPEDNNGSVDTAI